MLTTPTLTHGMQGHDREGPSLLPADSPSDCFQLFELPADFASSESSATVLLSPAVEISPRGAAKRQITGRHSIVTENVYGPARRRIEFRFKGPVHLLVMYDEGARLQGETIIEGLPPSNLRTFANKLTFVPAGRAYYEWHETAAPIRVRFIYFSSAKFRQLDTSGASRAPRVFFEDLTVRETAAKLSNALERGEFENSAYLDSLFNVLAHELSRSGQVLKKNSIVSRGGLASWQMRAVASYMEEHLEEQVPIVTLARVARLSQFHFCRAFKQSFGIPPHQYHLQRRIQRAKALLADQEASVTDIGLSLGYSQTSAFTVAFRKITGRTPSAFRRDFA
jgi:AraC family transcriptional regulator